MCHIWYIHDVVAKSVFQLSLGIQKDEKTFILHCAANSRYYLSTGMYIFNIKSPSIGNTTESSPGQVLSVPSSNLGFFVSSS